MNIGSISEQVRREGFAEITTVERNPAATSATMPLPSDGADRRRRDHDHRGRKARHLPRWRSFHLDNGVQHEERYGPAGLYYLVGKDKTRPDRQRSREVHGHPPFSQARDGHRPAVCQGPCSNLPGLLQSSDERLQVAFEKPVRALLEQADAPRVVQYENADNLGEQRARLPRRPPPYPSPGLQVEPERAVRRPSAVRSVRGSARRSAREASCHRKVEAQIEFLRLSR